MKYQNFSLYRALSKKNPDRISARKFYVHQEIACSYLHTLWFQTSNLWSIHSSSMAGLLTYRIPETELPSRLQ